MRKILAAIVLILLPSLAWAQSTLLQGGPFAQGRAPMYVGSGSSQPIVQDSGPAGGGTVGLGLSELLLTARGTGTPPYVGQGTGPNGTNSCDYDAPITNGTGYHYLCFSPNATVDGVQGGQIVFGAGGGASTLPLQFCVNGTCYTPGGTIAGLAIGTTTVNGGTNGYGLYNNNGVLGNEPIVLGPGSSTVACAAPWANTIGTLLGNNCDISIASGGVTINPALAINVTSSGCTEAAGVRAPFYICNDASANNAGQNLGFQIWVGNNPTATPGANNYIPGTIYINNLNSRSGIWTLNTIAQQISAGGGGSTGIVHGHECDVISEIAPTTATDPYSAGSVVHCQEMVASAGGTLNPQVANWIWSATTSAATNEWWAFGNGCARVLYACIVGADYTGDSASTSFTKALIWDKSSSAYIIKDGPNLTNAATAHSGIFDFSQSPGIGNFVLGLAGAGTNILFTNGVAQAMTLTIDSGGASTSENSTLTFSDQGSGKWSFFKDTGPNFNFENVATGHTIYNVNVSSDLTTWERAINFTSTFSVGGFAMTFPGLAATLLYSGGALGTPSSGTVTNLTGTASININGTVGATTPTTGAFTTATLVTLVGSGSAPTCASTGIGASGTCTINTGGNDLSGTIVLTPAGAGISASGTITLTLAAAVGTHDANCQFSPANGGTGSWTATSIAIPGNISTTAPTGVWVNGAGSPNLTSGDGYNVKYTCAGN